MPGLQAMVAATKLTKVQRRARSLRGAETKRVKQAYAAQAQIEAATPPQQKADDQIHQSFLKDPLLWGHVFFGHRLTKATPRFHVEILRGAQQSRYLAVAAPRESAKSELLSFLYPFHGIIFKRFHFIVILSNTFTKASMYLEAMKTELRENQALRQCFDEPIQVVKDAEGDSDFRHHDGFSTKVLCKGRDQIGSIRGVKFGPHRPDLIICDDVEDDKSVENPVLRAELERNYDEALVPAGDKDKCRYIVIGTILHDDSQVAKMVKQEGRYPEYTKLFYQAHLSPDQPGETSLWPEKWTLTELRDLRANKPLVYAKEMQNDPVAGLAVGFNPDDFRYWRLQENDYVLLDQAQSTIIRRGSLRDCRAAIACDLAWKEARTADFCVILSGFLTPTSDILVDTIVAKKGMRPDEIEELLFSLDQRLETLTGSDVSIGFEKAMLENVTQWILKQSMRERNRFLTLKELAWGQDKLERIRIRLQARYAQHAIFHQHGMGELEHQLSRFPSAAHDDLPDALQGLVQLLQYPKAKKAEVQQDDPFMTMRRLAIHRALPVTRPGLFRLNRQTVASRYATVVSPFPYDPVQQNA